MAIPQMVSLLVFRNLLNGQFSPINQFLMDIGVISENIGFLSDPVSAKVVVILVSFWLGFPMFMVMMMGVLQIWIKVFMRQLPLMEQIIYKASENHTSVGIQGNNAQSGHEYGSEL